jgi:5'-methylthioadenosine phosphorylase
VPSQFIDRTRHREDSFFGGGVVAHASLADPVCPVLSETLAGAGQREGLEIHRGATYVCMEGPQFSTRAESRLYRSWGADVIGMTNLTEARLAREAEICYASLALVTDYDCWHETAEDVSVEVIVAILGENAAAARRTLAAAVAAVDPSRGCGCRDAMRFAIITDRATIPDSARERLRPIAGRYL